MSIEEKVKKIVAKQLGKPLDEIKSKMFFQELGADLLDMIDIVDELKLFMRGCETENLLAKGNVEDLIKETESHFLAQRI